jgi:DNA-binding beta-propeller fold protein YncE
VAASGGEPAALTETRDYAPFAVTLSKVGAADNLYFIGTDPKAGNVPGIFMDSGGTVTAVIEGAAALDPQAVAVAGDGTVYYVDSNGGVQKVAAGKAVALLTSGTKSLNVSFPAGIAVSQDGKAVLVPDLDPATLAPGIARIDVSSGAVTHLTLTPVLTAANSQGGGFHRAANADVYTFVDSGAGTGTGALNFSTGTVYLLK